MGAARRITAAPWTRPGAPRVSAHPSWMGMPRVAPVESAPASSRTPSNRPPPDSVRGRHGGAEQTKSVRPPSMPPVVVPLAALSSPPSSPIIRSGRELELEAEVQALREEAARLAVELASVRSRILEDSEPEVVRLAMTIATRVVGREVSADPSIVLGWIREGLAVLPGRDAPVVAVAPDIAAAISLEVVLAEAGCRNVVVDASLRPGSCELREGASVVTIGADDRLAAISDALGIERGPTSSWGRDSGPMDGGRS